MSLSPWPTFSHISLFPLLSSLISLSLSPSHRLPLHQHTEPSYPSHSHTHTDTDPPQTQHTHTHRHLPFSLPSLLVPFPLVPRKCVSSTWQSPPRLPQWHPWPWPPPPADSHQTSLLSSTSAWSSSAPRGRLHPFCPHTRPRARTSCNPSRGQERPPCTCPQQRPASAVETRPCPRPERTRTPLSVC